MVAGSAGTSTGEPAEPTAVALRELILDPGRDYQPTGRHQGEDPEPPEPPVPAPLNQTAARSRRQGWPQATRRARP